MMNEWMKEGSKEGRKEDKNKGRREEKKERTNTRCLWIIRLVLSSWWVYMRTVGMTAISTEWPEVMFSVNTTYFVEVYGNLKYIPKMTHISVNLAFFSGISSCERQNFDMMKSQLSCVDFTASRRFGKKNPELLPESYILQLWMGTSFWNFSYLI